MVDNLSKENKSNWVYFDGKKEQEIQIQKWKDMNKKNRGRILLNGLQEPNADEYNEEKVIDLEKDKIKFEHCNNKLIFAVNGEYKIQNSTEILKKITEKFIPKKKLSPNKGGK